MRRIALVISVILFITSCAFFRDSDDDDNPPVTPTPSPTPIPDTYTIDDFVEVFDVAKLYSTHPDIIEGEDYKAIPAAPTEDQIPGYLCYGQYVTGYPQQPLQAHFSMWIDDNSADDNVIAYIDVFDATSGESIAGQVISRKDFSVKNAYTLFTLDFTPLADSNLEFRIYYLGWAYLKANKIAIADPERVSLTSPDQIPDASPPSPTPTPVPTVSPEPTPTPDDTFCRGDELLCISSMTSDAVAQYNGTNRGGAFSNGTFAPTSTGGLTFPLTIDASRSFVVEFELEGDIPNWEKGEHDGGKPSLFTMAETNGTYYLNLQRMYNGYRGSGVFRVILGDRVDLKDNAAFLPTSAGFGAYSMRDWGDEVHWMQVSVSGNRCRLRIDNNYVSSEASAPYGISRQRRVTFVLGNREVGALGMRQGALTRFRKLKIAYR